MRASARSARLLVGTAALPFFLLRCNPKPSPPPGAHDTAVVTEGGAPTLGASPQEASVSNPASSSSSSSSPSPSPSSSVPSTKRCAELDTAIARALGERACKTNAECVWAITPCSCGGVVARGAVAQVELLGKEWVNANCYKTPDRACPSCAPSPPPRCVKGTCR